MTEQPKPNLDLGTPPGKLKSRSSGAARWAPLLILLQVATLGLIAYPALRSGGSQTTTLTDGTSPETIRAEAIELEDRSLNAEAAACWERYLGLAPDSDERASILYRIGRLYMEAEQFDRAAAAFVRSELAGADDKELKGRIAPKMVECLRRLGRYGEVDRELSRRVEVGGEETDRGEVLATMAGDEITEADLDRMVERQIDANLAMMGQSGNEEMRKAMLQRQNSTEQRRQMLEQLLQIKLFTRRARELKLDQDEEFKLARQSAEDMLLAQRFRDRELGKIVPTQVDLEAYYQTHIDEYKTPESLTVLPIDVTDDEDPEQLVEGIESPEAFRSLAAERGEAGEEPPRVTVQRGRTHPQLGNTDALFELSADQWTADPIEYEGKRYLVLVEEKTPEQTRPLDEAADQVRLAYQQQKQQELGEKLFRDLMTRYDVELVSPAASGQEVQQP